jgi:peptide/nickel transport system permease protein
MARASGNKWAAGAAAILLCMYGTALFAGFFAPYGMNQTHYKAPAGYRYHPPMRLRMLDQEGRLHWPPFVYGTKSLGGPERGYAEDRTIHHALKFFARGEPYSLFFGLVEWDRHLIGVEEPGRVFLLGTDKFGRDLLSRIIYGSRISLSVGLLGIAITLCLGLGIGATSGLLGGYPDSILMRLSEVVMSLPGLYLVVALAGVLPPELPSDTRYLLIVAILSLVGWAVPARVIRGMVLSIRENDYVLAAKAVGAGTPRIVLRHVIPNTMSYIIVAATINVPYYILGEVSLSFLGVGVMEPQASWGLMLSDAQSVTALREFTWLLLPGAFLFLAVMSFNILGDGLRDALDPRARGTRAL